MEACIIIMALLREGHWAILLQIRVASSVARFGRALCCALSLALTLAFERMQNMHGSMNALASISYLHNNLPLNVCKVPFTTLRVPLYFSSILYHDGKSPASLPLHYHDYARELWKA